MNAWFNARTARERLILAAAAALLLLALLWLAAWEPLQQQRDSYRARVERQQLILLQLQQLADNADQLQGASSVNQPRGDQSLLGLADRTVRAAGLAGALRRIEPDGDGHVRLSLQQAPFDTLITWLESLAADYGVHVSGANISRGDGAGLVVADITLADAP